MKIELRCPGCGKGYLMEEDSAGGELICPACSSRVATPPRPVPESAPPPHPGSEGIAAAASAAAPAPEPASAQEKVICPRCQLHFVPRRAAASERGPQRRTVLVVEDMAYFREIAADALSSRYEVKSVANLDEARAAIAAGGIDLMVLDLTLDGGDHGIELLRGLAVKPCPILIFTAQDESEMYGDSWDELRALGADDLVMKGMNVGESLRRKVGALLGEHWDEEE
jgi:CheY-like chemotaxis protein/DNA-directed RNA polymerase subunit RPC12/RpoP